MRYREIRFKGRKFLLIKGAIATKRQYEYGLRSFAHLYENGEIWRLGKKIGTKKDVEYLGLVEANPRIFLGLYNMLGWT